FVTEDFYSEALAEEARAEGLGGRVTTLAVFPGSPAELAGLQVGDRLVAIDGKRTPSGPRATGFAVKKLKRLLRPGEKSALEIQRGDQTLTLEVEPTKGAYYPVVVVAGGEPAL